MKTEMTKSDLKDFMLVQYRNGDVRMLENNCLFIENGISGNYLKEYNDDLLDKTLDSCSIVKISSPITLEEILKGTDWGILIEKYKIWEREEKPKPEMVDLNEIKTKIEQIFEEDRLKINEWRKLGFLLNGVETQHFNLKDRFKKAHLL